MKYRELRKKYPRFVYEKYSYQISRKNLNISFSFKIEPNIYFAPKLTVKNINQSRVAQLNDKVLNNLIFHLGLAEIPSYWKTTCSPEIEIKASHLNKERVKWWKDLIINGMGQFFYENKINFRKSHFLTISTTNKVGSCRRINKIGSRKNRVLVPIGGGKDSVVTLEILKRARKKINCFSLNPTEATKKTMGVGGCKNPIIVRRKIDKKLLQLNRRGFLNGHTPFSAYLAFLSILLSLIFDKKFIAFSNERSSNEGNLIYLGKRINHQWSKSFEFEKKFRNYSKKYLVKNIEYFSFLRPLYEIQIAELFSKFPKYFPVFLSCNEAYKTASGTKKPSKKWCGKCPKCLFVFACLYPFVKTQKLIEIFRKNLFKDKRLSSLMLQLIGEKKVKPFECVGTKKESLIAFYLSWKKVREVFPDDLPYLLKYFENKVLPKYKNLEKESKKIIKSWNNQHNLPKEFKKILKKTVNF